MSKPRISRHSSKALAARRAKGEDRTDWTRLRAMNDATATRNARADADNPPLSARDFARAKVVRRGRRGTVEVELPRSVVRKAQEITGERTARAAFTALVGLSDRPKKNPGVFIALRNRALFEQVYIEHGAVTWPGELDLAPDAMYDEIKKNGSWTLKAFPTK